MLDKLKQKKDTYFQSIRDKEEKEKIFNCLNISKDLNNHLFIDIKNEMKEQDEFFVELLSFHYNHNNLTKQTRKQREDLPFVVMQESYKKKKKANSKEKPGVFHFNHKNYTLDGETYSISWMVEKEITDFYILSTLPEKPFVDFYSMKNGRKTREIDDEMRVQLYKINDELRIVDEALKLSQYLYGSVVKLNKGETLDGGTNEFVKKFKEYPEILKILIPIVSKSDFSKGIELTKECIENDIPITKDILKDFFTKEYKKTGHKNDFLTIKSILKKVSAHIDSFDFIDAINFKEDMDSVLKKDKNNLKIKRVKI